MEHVLKQDIDDTWEYAVRNEQYSRKNNTQGRTSKKLWSVLRRNISTKISSKIVHRIGHPKVTDGERGSSASASDQRSVKPRPVIVKFVSNKMKMRLLRKRRELKGKRMVIQEDMAPDIAKRLKKLKEKGSVESSWFSNGKIKFKLKYDSESWSSKVGWTYKTFMISY